MLEQVRAKIEELKITGAKEYYRKKDSDLESWGLTSKKDGKKKVPIIVTNEEYEELIKAANGVGATGRNKIAKMLNTLAICVLVVGAIAGGAALAVVENLSFLYFSLAVIVAIISAAILKGISEAVKLLQQIIDAKCFDTPKLSKEELDATVSAAPMQEIEQPQHTTPYNTLYVDSVTPQPVQAPVQPPIYQAQRYQPTVAQPYQSHPPVYTAPSSAPATADEMNSSYEAFNEKNANPFA